MTWYIPRWSYAQQLWSQLNWILNPASLFRITLASAMVSAVILAGLRLVFPQMVLPNFWPSVLSLPVIVLMLVANFGILTLIPPTITIRSDKIIVQHGQSTEIIDSNTVMATYLTFHGNNRIRLRLCYRRKSKLKSRVIGVPPTVDFSRLQSTNRNAAGSPSGT